MKMVLLLLRLSLLWAFMARPKRWSRRMYHVRKGIAYIVENSQWATRLAKRLGFHWIDKDTHVTADDVPVFGHWGMVRKNGVLLPRWFIRKYGRDARISDVVWEDLARLRSWRMFGRRFKFVKAVNGMKLAADLGMGIGWEYKGDKLMRTSQFWDEVDELRRRAGLPASKLVAMTLPGMRGAGAFLRAAHNSGRQTMVIRANEGVPRSWEPYMTWYRGKIKWIEHA